MITLANVLEAYAKGGNDAVAALFTDNAIDDATLATLIDEARKGFADVYGDGTAAFSAEDADVLDQLASVVEVLAGEQSDRAQAAAATNDRVQQLAGKVLAKQGTDDGTGDGDGDQGDPDGGDAGDQGTTDQPGGGQSTGDPAPATPPATPPAQASKSRPDVLARLARSRNTSTPPAVPKAPQLTLLAASDVPDTPAGMPFADIRAVSEAVIRRLQVMPKPMEPGTPSQMRAALAVIPKNTPAEFVAKDVNDYAVLEHAANERRLPGGSLVAAGGWCSPSETIYDFFELETTDGLLSLPETVWARGGIKFTKGPDFSELYTDTGFAQTEAQAIADTPKTCFEVPCNDWEEERLDLIGLCIKAGILMNATYPELIDRYIRGALVAHAHRINASRIARIVAATTLVTMTGGYWTAQGATSATLEAIELQVVDYRTKYRMGLNTSLEGFAPQWLRPILRADLAKRNGVDLRNVTNADLDAHFNARGVRLQFVYDYMDAQVNAGTGMGAAGAATAWPTTVDIVLYAAGTFVGGTNDVIRLDAGIYDSVNIMTNKYNALFTEEGIAVAMRGLEARRVRVPLCASGNTAQQVDMDCTA